MPGPERVIVLFGGSEDYRNLTSRRPGPPLDNLAKILARPVFFLGAAAGRDDQQSSVFEAVCAEPGARPCDGVRLQPERRLRAGRRADTGEVVIRDVRPRGGRAERKEPPLRSGGAREVRAKDRVARSEEHTSELQSRV